MIAAIWAQDENGLIGKEQKLPWHLPNDLKFFKHMTEKNTIVMGRKTFEGMGKRALPNRTTIVLTTDSSYQAENVLVMHSLKDVLTYAKAFEGMTYITGGANIYEIFMPFTDVLYCTKIYHSFTGDTYFPEINWNEWTMVNISEGEVDKTNIYRHQFETYQRK